MTPPIAGISHDVVFHLNDSISCGVILKPGTYRVAVAPTFIPRLAVGDPKGIDKSRWRSWTQSRFDGGMGQIFHSGTQGNNRYAESNLMDIGLPMSVIGGVGGRSSPVVGPSFGEELDESPIGDVQVALIPQSTTAESRDTRTLFTNHYRVHMLEMSNRPHMFHYRSAFVYTNLTGVDVWAQGAVAGVDEALTGRWAVMHSQLPAPILHATKYSGVGILAIQNTLMAYGPYPLQTSRSTVYAPVYGTAADRVGVYDSRLWRAVVGQAAYFEPSTRVWSTFIAAGDPSIPINNMVTAFGRYYWGKEDSLWVFDAGRTYEVENYAQERDPANFNLMVVHRGALYYNIKQKIYRITSGNLIELLQTPPFSGTVQDGSSVGGELLILIREPNGEGLVWIFSDETGGTRQWFSTADIAYRRVEPTSTFERAPKSIATAFGFAWIAPMTMSAHHASDNAIPVAVVNRLNPAQGPNVPRFARTHAYLIGSLTDFGFPNHEKQVNRAVIDYALGGLRERIDVSWLPEIKQPRLVGAYAYDIAANRWYDGTSALASGFVDPSRGSLQLFPAGNTVEFFFGFDQPVQGYRIIMGSGHSGPPSAAPVYVWEAPTTPTRNVQVENKSFVKGGGTDRLTWQHAIGPGSQQALLVAAQIRARSATVDYITANSTSLTRLFAVYKTNGDADFPRIEVFRLDNPAQGPLTIDAKLSATPAQGWVAGALSLDNVDLVTNPFSFSYKTGEAVGVSMPINTTVGAVVIDFAMKRYSDDPATYGEGQEELYRVPTHGMATASQKHPTADQTTMKQDWRADRPAHFAYGVLNVNPGTNTFSVIALESPSTDRRSAISDGTNGLRRSGIVDLGDLPNWTSSRLRRMDLASPSGVQGLEAYWTKLLYADTPTTFQMVSVTPIWSLRKQLWQPLGAITDPTQTRKSLPMPAGTIAHGVSLRFDARGTDVSRPEIRRMEVEYLPIGQPQKTIYGVAMAIDRIETQHLGVVENSAHFIQASLFSMHHAGRTYVTQLPWPSRGSTINALVTILDPGAWLPLLAYSNTIAGSEIPIRIDEM